ncbi:MAG: hypothetical protein PHN60_02735 [Candidatus Gracilibacteria bacterium]|nr:hypothetical protein [Candidatus Gracilibacteria bacterium]
MTRLRNRSNSSPIGGNSFSFIVPFAIALIILIVIIRYMFSSSPTENHTGSFMTVTPKQEQSEIYIYMSGDSKKRIDGATKMYATDSKLTVSLGEAEAGFENSTSKLFIDKGGEVRYEGVIDGKQIISLENADMLADSSTSDMIIKLKNFFITPSDNSVIILSQNIIASNIYVLKGSALVEDYSKKSTSTSIGVGQQLTIMKNDLSSNTLQFASKIEPLSDYIKTTNLFINHNGDSLLSSMISSEGTGSTDASGSLSVKNTKIGLTITSPEDESTVDTSEITIEGKLLNTDITKVTINDKEALIDKEQKSFLYKSFPLASSSNNIVYKAYDSEGGILAKGILTIYTSQKIGKEDASKKPSVTTYPISDKDFRIISPTENPYKTTDDVVRIEGRVNKGIVKYITINDYRLSKFPQLGTSWYYFANKDYGTMNDGINLYTIKYYGENDELLFTNLFTIVKEKVEDIVPTPISTSTGTTATGSSTEG